MQLEQKVWRLEQLRRRELVPIPSRHIPHSEVELFLGEALPKESQNFCVENFHGPRTLWVRFALMAALVVVKGGLWRVWVRMWMWCS